jgi:hypothetical protein
MDTIDDTSTVYNEIQSLNPFVVFIVSFIGLALTLFFTYIFRNSLIESYGNKIYFWFFILVALNLINITFITGYFQSMYKKNVGESGKTGVKGNQGKSGDNSVCGYCNDTSEIGIQYSNKYHLISKLSKTTNIIGEISLWRSVGMLGLASIGDCVFAQNNSSQIRTYMAGYGSVKPTDFKKLIHISDGVRGITLWEPVPPKGYSFLGHFVTFNSRKPDLSLAACLPTECLIKSYMMAYVASFPAIDIIPTNGSQKIEFCSFWQTQLNHLICKISTSVYSTDSVYYNIVDGHPEYYNKSKKEPIPEKVQELKRMLEDKPSIIFHMPTNKDDVKFVPVFIENMRDEKGKVYAITVYSKTFIKYISNIPTFENYISYYLSTITYINNFILEKNIKIFFKNDTNVENKAYDLLKTIIDKCKSDQEYYTTLSNFIKIFKSNPNIVIKAFQDDAQTFGVSKKMYADMSLSERSEGFLNIIGMLDLSDLKAAIAKLKNIGVNEASQLMVFDIYAQKKKAEIQAIGDVEQVNPNLTLWDDLYYLFPAGLDDQIVGDERDALTGGYYLLDIDNRQRKHFIDYLRTFIKPLIPSFGFRKKCMMFIDTDPERNQIINDLVQIYNVVGRELENINKLGTCDKPEIMTNLYNSLKTRIDKQFRSIDNYSEKIENQEFSYFATSKLKWLLNEMNTYYSQIKAGCKSDERSDLINSIRNQKKRLASDFNYSVDFEQYWDQYKIIKMDDINIIVEKLDTDQLTIEQLRIINEIYKKNLTDKLKEIKSKLNK